ncbi:MULTISPECIES: hypothetical protein [unclassified Geodermatophilus]|uniref:hypothetical protein n=1 Tax=unclassified Geodermatophilus TaxID=2637632 RepID=UPI003EEF5DDB
MAFTLCADFTLFPDDTILGPGFTFAAMDFQDVPGGSSASFVNATAGERGLQFPHTGLEVGLPVPVLYARACGSGSSRGRTRSTAWTSPASS